MSRATRWNTACIIGSIMMIQIDREQSEVLKEILATSLRELKIESSRADSHDYREGLHHREDIVESILSKLDPEANLLS